MIRSLAFAALFLVAGSVPSLAQKYLHGPDHVRPGGNHPPHGPDHAAMHALLHGSWTGTLRSEEGVTSRLSMSVARDSTKSVSLSMTTEQPMRLGAVRSLAINGDKLTWTQELAGASCKATAVVSAATPHAPEEFKGVMACDQNEITFSLRKTAG